MPVEKCSRPAVVLREGDYVKEATGWIMKGCVAPGDGYSSIPSISFRSSSGVVVGAI